MLICHPLIISRLLHIPLPRWRLEYGAPPGLTPEGSTGVGFARAALPGQCTFLADTPASLLPNQSLPSLSGCMGTACSQGSMTLLGETYPKWVLPLLFDPVWKDVGHTTQLSATCSKVSELAQMSLVALLIEGTFRTPPAPASLPSWVPFA